MLYGQTLDALGSFIRQTREGVRSSAVKDAVLILRTAKRIFFTGSGSSIPAAMFAGRLSSERYGFPAQFSTTSQVVGEEKLGKEDVVVMVSQGWNRSDALLVTDHVRKSKAKLIGLTGNADSPHPRKSDMLFTFYPPYREERIFCRPASVITSYSLLSALVMRAGGDSFSWDTAQKAANKGVIQGKRTELPQAERHIVLSSGLALAAATNVCLALREGAGLFSQVYEIESYGHGWYVPDQLRRAQGGAIRHILVSHLADRRTEFAVKRILPLLKKTNTPYEIWRTKGLDPVYGNIQILARAAQAVYGSITGSGYDMNFPPGKEENRYFHDILIK